MFDGGIVKDSIENLWQAAEQAILPSGVSRGRPCFFTLGDLSCNYRHYRRGGMVESLLQDRYFGSGRQENRAFNEFKLLVEMRNLTLPVPQPVAARVYTGPFFYRADLITLRIPGAVSLADFLSHDGGHCAV